MTANAVVAGSSATWMNSDDDDCESQNWTEDSQNSMENQSLNLMETVRILNHDLDLPKNLCALPAVFNELFTPGLWAELPAEIQEHLMTNFLPTFPENDAQEKAETIRKLFAREEFRFGKSPLVEFQRNLEEGNFLSNVVKYRVKIAKNERHERRYQECERVSRLAQRLVASKNRLLKHSYNAPYGTPAPISNASASTTSGISRTATAVRAKKRYFNEIASIAQEMDLPLSSEEEMEEELFLGDSSQSSRSRRLQKPLQNPVMINNASSPTETKVRSTFCYKNGGAIEQRLLDGSSDANGITLNEDYYKAILYRHRKRKGNDPVSCWDSLYHSIC